MTTPFLRTHSTEGTTYGSHHTSSGSSSNNNNSQENVPLRRRNDYFINPEGSFTDFPYPPYSELPFTSLKRRKQQEGNKFVKWTMRAVLASPVLVLVLWSTCSFLFSSRTITQIESSKRGTTIHGLLPTKHRRNNNNNNKGGRNSGRMIPVINPLGSTSTSTTTTTATNNGSVTLLPPPPQQQQLQQQVMPEQGNTYMMAGPNVVIRPHQGSTAEQEPKLMTANGYLVNPDSYMLTGEQQQQQQPQAIQQVQPQEPYTAVNHNIQGQILPVYAPLGSTSSSNNGVVASSSGGAPIVPLLPVGATSNTNNINADLAQRNLVPLGSTSSNTGSTTTNIQYEPQPPPPLTHGHGAAAAHADSNIIRHRSAPRATNTNTNLVVDLPQTQQQQQQQQQNLIENGATTEVQSSQRQQVYYYDAKEATDANGQLKVPSIVYDLNGKPIQVQALQSTAEIFLEPPPSKTMPKSIRDYKPAWGESPMQDQSIIISTVAVMALLVGALSARRLRSRSFLSSCIENESLEDDVAYDTAYTTNADNSYNTFGGWRGDLEKFDV